MAKRRKIIEPAKNNYFTAPKDHHLFVSTGCTVLDCALGGGFALGRVANVVGDKSTSKTGMSTEALINFCRTYPDGRAAYRDREAAFDKPYAEAMGLPVDEIDFGDPDMDNTVEAFHRDLEKFVSEQLKTGKPGLYVLDSLDAVSDEAELERDIGEGSYGGNKPKKLSELFRRLTPEIERSKVLLLIVSQIRDNIGAMFGEKHKRSGGKALDFYASQIVWLANLGQLKRTIGGVERVYGFKVRANVKKNKVALAHRRCDFEFHFGYGMEDLITSVNWLAEVKQLDAIDLKPTELKNYLKEIPDMTQGEYRKELDMVNAAVRRIWPEIEERFLPKRSKYA